MHNEIILPLQWNKLHGKKVFLWTTDHGILSGNITFDLYVQAFFDYFRKREDCGLIIRLHPIYINELCSNVWSSEEYKEISAYCEESDNIIWDTTNDYTLSYSIADCVITDVNCGIILSALTIDKPICVLRRFDNRACEILHPNVIEYHNVVNSISELAKFLDRVCAGEDPKSELRKEALTKFISHYDGKNGERIKDLKSPNAQCF